MFFICGKKYGLSVAHNTQQGFCICSFAYSGEFSVALCWLATQANAEEICSIRTLFPLLKENSFVILCSVGNISMNTHFLKHAFTVCLGLRPLSNFFLKEKPPHGLSFGFVIKAEASCIFKNL